MSIEDFFSEINNQILGWTSVTYPDKWPKCTVYLSSRQFAKVQSLNELELKTLVIQIEHKTVAYMNENKICHAGILGTTKVELVEDKQAIVIDGSFSVIERLVCWIIEKAS